jgi:hypothetical protein
MSGLSSIRVREYKDVGDKEGIIEPFGPIMHFNITVNSQTCHCSGEIYGVVIEHNIQSTIILLTCHGTELQRYTTTLLNGKSRMPDT